MITDIRMWACEYLRVLLAACAICTAAHGSAIAPCPDEIDRRQGGSYRLTIVFHDRLGGAPLMAQGRLVRNRIAKAPKGCDAKLLGTGVTDISLGIC